MKTHLACRFEAAFDLLLFHLARSVFGQGCCDGALDGAARPTPDAPGMRANDPAFAKASVGIAHLAGDRVAQSLDWLDRPTGEAFAALRAMDDWHKQQLFASCVARTLKGQLAFEPGARPEVEATVARLDVAFARLYRPGAALFFGRLRKDRLLAIARETLGEAWAAALAWVPPGFRAFDTARAEEAEADAPTSEAVPPANGGDASVAAPAEPPAVPGNGHDPDALPAFLRHMA